MALDTHPLTRTQTLSIGEFIRRGVEVDAYADATGWSHTGLTKLANTFDVTAQQCEPLHVEDIQKALQDGWVALISVKRGFEPRKTLKERILFWKKSGGHLALVIGYRVNGDHQLEGFYVHHTSTREEYDWQDRFIPLSLFKQGFVGRGLLVKTSSQELIPGVSHKQ